MAIKTLAAGKECIGSDIFVFATPVAIFLPYFLAVEMRTGVAWSVHLWLGATFVSGVIAYMLSYLIIPPAYK